MEKGTSDPLDKELVASCFQASAATYEESAVVQREISRQLIAILQRFTPCEYSRVLEIGCCTGNLTEMLGTALSIDSFFINDLVADFCKYTEKRIAGRVGRVNVLPGDIETAFLPNNLDLVISSSTFQWIVDFPGLLSKISSALTETGHLAFSIFSPGTMGEISALTGRSLRYLASDELAAMLAEHFRVISMHSETKRLFFPSVRAVLRHIRQTGVRGVDRKKWNIRELKEFERRYVEQFLTEDGLQLTYVSTFVVAEKKRGVRS